MAQPKELVTVGRSDSGSAPGVRRADESHFTALAEFFQRVWDPSADAERVRSAWASEAEANPVEPGVPPPAFVFLKAGEVIGYVSTIPARFLVAGRREDGYWLKGLWVLPEHQGGPVGFHLVRTAAAELGPLGALAVAQPARRLFEAVGFRDVAQPPNYVWPLRASRLFARLDPSSVLGDDNSLIRWLWIAAQRTGLAGPSGAVATAAVRIGRKRVDQAGLKVTEGWDPFPIRGADVLWDAMAEPGYCGLVRDASYLQWRYRRRGARGYRPIMVMDAGAEADGRLLALAVLRLPRLQESGRFAGVRIAWLCDLIFDPRDSLSMEAAQVALHHAELMAREAGGDLLALSFSGPGYDRVFSHCRYFRQAPSIHLLLKGFADSEASDSDREWDSLQVSCNWVVGRGDGDSDGAS